MIGQLVSNTRFKSTKTCVDSVVAKFNLVYVELNWLILSQICGIKSSWECVYCWISIMRVAPNVMPHNDFSDAGRKMCDLGWSVSIFRGISSERASAHT